MPITSNRYARGPRLWLTLAAISVIVLAALVIAGTRPTTVRTYALDAPSQDQVALLRPGSQVCEGPVTSRQPIRAIGIWGASVVGPAEVRVDVQNAATRRSLGSGQLRASTHAGPYSARLSRPIRGGASLRV
jgi:hypothetical protein